MDKNGYFCYAAATAKKKKISLMQWKAPRVAFTEEASGEWGGNERSFYVAAVSTAQTERRVTRAGSMSQRPTTSAPRARINSQLECYQPRYHAIRDRETDSRRVLLSQDCVDQHRQRTQPKKYVSRPDSSTFKSHHVNLHGAAPPSSR